ncbi:MAG TPA: CDP-alcohol phosphatidyltransferase family protein, partial [Candidatus Polarisedimenticolaceae bacterium]|nr:CDP-alcohol phosphatidyltransferase family protein [Candidatus Polarisedimenticolaceae bacterium]
TNTVLRSPNTISILGVVLCWIAGVLVATHHWLAGACLFAAGSACDFFDGRWARRRSDQSRRKMGGFVDSMCDKLGEAGYLLGLSFGLQAKWQVVLLFAAYWPGIGASIIKANSAASRDGVSWREVKILGRGSRAVLYVFIALSAGLFSPTFLTANLWSFLGLNLIAFAWRAKKVGGRAAAYLP